MLIQQLILLRKIIDQQWLCKEAFDKLQQRKLLSILKHAYKNVPYYRRIWKEKKININYIKTVDDLKKLPIITKDDLKENYCDFIAENSLKKNIIHKIKQLKLRLTTDYAYNYGHPAAIQIGKNKIFVLFSSGTAGPSLPILYDGKAWMYAECVYLRSFLEAGYNPFKPLVYHWSTPFKKRLYNYFGLIRKEQIFPSISEKEQIQILKNLNPRFIFYPPAALFFISKKILNENVVLKAEAIFTSGEVLTSEMRDTIERCFKASIYDHYSASEFDYIAWQCKVKNFYHINSDSLILEVVNSDGKRVTGTPGDIVITGLFNYLMPLIRYKIADIGCLVNDRCRCRRNLPLLAYLGGRTSKLIQSASGRIFMPKEIIDIVAGVEEIEKFRIIYCGDNKFRIKAVTRSEVNNIYNIVRFKLENLLKEDIQVEIQKVESISKERSGKLNLLILNSPGN